MRNSLADVYPVVTSCGTLMKDADFVSLVRDRIGQDVALVLEHRFVEQKKLHEQKLHWWKHQKPHKQYSSIYIYEKCSEHGAAILYYEDAINAFKKDGGAEG